MTTRDQERDPESSSEEATDQPDANTAVSSDAEPSDANEGGDESREDLLSVINDVVDGESGSEEDSEPAGESSEPDPEAETASEDEEGEAEEDGESEDGDESEKDEDAESEEDPPFHKHPRWKEMVAERDQLKEPAENYQRIQSFMESNGLEPQEVAEGFQLMALMKNDPAQARQLLDQKMQTLRQFDPNHVPQDLQADVDSGAITQERARELAQLRAQSNNTDFQNRRLQEQNQASQEQARNLRQQNANVQLATAVNEWESQIQSKDADYARKAPLVHDRLRALMTEKGRPETADAAVKLAKQAYDDVNKRVSGFNQERKRPRKPTPSGGSSKTNTEPTTLEQAIDQAIDG